MFAMDDFRLFHRSQMMPAVPTRAAGVIDAGEFLLFLPSAVSALLHTAQTFFVYVSRNGRTSLNWISLTFVTRTGDRFTAFFLPSPQMSWDNPSDHMNISIIL
jgi:hypothetical protein